MKKIIFLMIFSLLVVSSAKAQNFTYCRNLVLTEPNVVRRNDYDATGLVDMQISTENWTHKPYGYDVIDNAVRIYSKPCNSGGTEIPSQIYAVNQTNGTMNEFNLTFLINATKNSNVVYSMLYNYIPIGYYSGTVIDYTDGGMGSNAVTSFYSSDTSDKWKMETSFNDGYILVNTTNAFKNMVTSDNSIILGTVLGSNGQDGRGCDLGHTYDGSIGYTSLGYNTENYKIYDVGSILAFLDINASGYSTDFVNVSYKIYKIKNVILFRIRENEYISSSRSWSYYDWQNERFGCEGSLSSFSYYFIGNSIGTPSSTQYTIDNETFGEFGVDRLIAYIDTSNYAIGTKLHFTSTGSDYNMRYMDWTNGSTISSGTYYSDMWLYMDTSGDRNNAFTVSKSLRNPVNYSIGEETAVIPPTTTTTISPSIPSIIVSPENLGRSCLDNNTLLYSGIINNQSYSIAKPCSYGCDDVTKDCSPSPFTIGLYIFLGILGILVVAGIIRGLWER